MTPSIPRRIALALLIALHGVATLCGTALHRHGVSAGPPRRNGDWQGDQQARTANVGGSHADCPVCRLLTQPQLGTDRTEVVFDQGRAEAPLLSVLEDLAPPARTSQPRAPPPV